ncbi:MAG TPA: hypothetical protein ENN09_06930 [Planctomycetes bacterium]|nr:hypothetical protein [Planctomycetota bacterium]
MAKRRGPEQRRKKRYSVTNIEVEYTEGNLFSFFKRSKPGKRPLVDLSTDGLQFLSSEHLRDGRVMKMTIALPDGRSVELLGQIRWVQQIPGKQLYRTGVAIVEIAPEGLTALQSLEEKLGDELIRVLCNACGAPFNAKKRLEGRKVKCPKCGKVIEIEEKEPEGGLAESGVHVSAPAGELRAMISEPLYLFLKHYMRTRLHLALVEYLARASGGANVFTLSDLAKALNRPERDISAICRDLTGAGILKEVGINTYNYGSGKTTREHMNELRRTSLNPKVRTAILQFVLQQEKKH